MKFFTNINCGFTQTFRIANYFTPPPRSKFFVKSKVPDKINISVRHHTFTSFTSFLRCKLLLHGLTMTDLLE
mgnify:CR=1 FL=1